MHPENIGGVGAHDGLVSFGAKHGDVEGVGFFIGWDVDGWVDGDAPFAWAGRFHGERDDGRSGAAVHDGREVGHGGEFAKKGNGESMRSCMLVGQNS